MDPINTPTAIPPQQPPKHEQTDKSLMPINFTWQLKLALISLVVVLFILLIVRVLPKTRTIPSLTSPQPSASNVTQATPSGQLSSYAQTETFNRFSQELDAYKTRLESLDLSENPLTFPLLDFNVQFDQR